MTPNVRLFLEWTHVLTCVGIMAPPCRASQEQEFTGMCIPPTDIGPLQELESSIRPQQLQGRK